MKPKTSLLPVRWVVRLSLGLAVGIILLPPLAQAATSSAESNVTAVDTRDGGTWTVRAYADRNGNTNYDAGEELAGAEVFYGKPIHWHPIRGNIRG